MRYVRCRICSIFPVSFTGRVRLVLAFLDGGLRVSPLVACAVRSRWLGHPHANLACVITPQKKGDKKEKRKKKEKKKKKEEDVSGVHSHYVFRRLLIVGRLSRSEVIGLPELEQWTSLFVLPLVFACHAIFRYFSRFSVIFLCL